MQWLHRMLREPCHRGATHPVGGKMPKPQRPLPSVVVRHLPRGSTLAGARRRAPANVQSPATVKAGPSARRFRSPSARFRAWRFGNFRGAARWARRRAPSNVQSPATVKPGPVGGKIPKPQRTLPSVEVRHLDRGRARSAGRCRPTRLRARPQPPAAQQPPPPPPDGASGGRRLRAQPADAGAVGGCSAIGDATDARAAAHWA